MLSGFLAPKCPEACGFEWAVVMMIGLHVLYLMGSSCSLLPCRRASRCRQVSNKSPRKALGEEDGGKAGEGAAAAGAKRMSPLQPSEEALGSDERLLPPRERRENGACASQGEGKPRQAVAREKPNSSLPVHAAQDRSSVENRTPAAKTLVRRRQGVEVSAENLWEAFLSTRPSLSSVDRARYDLAYRKFRGGSRQADFNPVSSIDDGSLRTALK